MKSFINPAWDSFFKNILPLKFLPLVLFATVVLNGNAAEAGATVGILKSNDKIVEIAAGEQGPSYTVKTLDGKLLARSLSLEALSQRFPDLGEMVEGGVADEASLFPNASETLNVNNPDTGL